MEISNPTDYHEGEEEYTQVTYKTSLALSKRSRAFKKKPTQLVQTILPNSVSLPLRN